MRGLSDRYMMKLWRQAVLIKWGGKCIFCQESNQDVLECHHIKKRKHKLTRYLVDNGVPVCKVKYGEKMSCHQRAETFEGQEIIKKLIGEKTLVKIDQLAHQTIKDYCSEHGISQSEYLISAKDELERVISDY